MKVHIVEKGTIDFPSVEHADVDLRGDVEAVRRAVAEAREFSSRVVDQDATVAWLVVEVMGSVIAATADPEMDVRQYALLALGTLADPETLDLLRSKLANGADPEVVSAISALARRPDGLADVLALASDPRPWVRDEVIRSIAYVAAPLSETQVATLTNTSQHPGLAAALEAQRRRLAPGGRELGADGHWFVVRRKDGPA